MQSLRLRIAKKHSLLFVKSQEKISIGFKEFLCFFFTECNFISLQEVFYNLLYEILAVVHVRGIHKQKYIKIESKNI